MPISKEQLSRLSNQEIARLYEQTRKLAIEEKYGASEKPSNSQWHRAPEGHMCDCKGGSASHYATESERYYIDASGAVLPLAAGERRPLNLRDERIAWACRLTERQLDDLRPEARAEAEEVRAAVLESEAQQFRDRFPEYNDTPENSQALIERLCERHLAFYPDGEDEAMSELLSRDCWSADSIAGAYEELRDEGRLTPRPGHARNLDADELRTLSAFCAGCRTDAEFERALNQYVYLATGSERGWRAVAFDARYSKVLESAILFCFENSQPDYSPTPERRQFLENHVAGRFPSVQMLRAGWELRKQAEAKGETQPPEQSHTPNADEQRLNEAQAMLDALAQEGFRGM